MTTGTPEDTTLASNLENFESSLAFLFFGNVFIFIIPFFLTMIKAAMSP